MLEIGNVYGHGFGPARVAEMARAGFTVRPEVSHYAGSQICRFLDFEDGPALELIEVADEKAYLDFVPKGMKPYAPGISLVVPDYAERELVDFEGRYQEWGPYSLHVNYDGSNDPGKPGWNYLNFERPVIRDTFVWLTRLDTPRPRRHLVPRHPNGSQGVVGLVVDLPEQGLERLARLTETKQVQGALDINGVKVYSRDALDVMPRFGAKAFPLHAMVVQVEDLEYFARECKEAEVVSFRSRPAIRIRTNDLSWDLLLTGP
jgi:hypothetical protein